MFEYVLCRYYYTYKGNLKEDRYWGNKKFNTLEDAIECLNKLNDVDPKGIYYIEHRIKLDYDTGINSI